MLVLSLKKKKTPMMEPFLDQEIRRSGADERTQDPLVWCPGSSPGHSAVSVRVVRSLFLFPPHTHDSFPREKRLGGRVSLLLL